jgi:hypothetical protein
LANLEQVGNEADGCGWRRAVAAATAVVAAALSRPKESSGCACLPALSELRNTPALSKRARAVNIFVYTYLFNGTSRNGRFLSLTALHGDLLTAQLLTGGIFLFSQIKNIY